ncbi:hypothetical protein NQZ68_001192 [Dissostichus eleginoides]|nr:hypothetical protein NQZ68_001192 [Dissostichus eleginoides]
MTDSHCGVGEGCNATPVRGHEHGGMSERETVCTQRRNAVRKQSDRRQKAPQKKRGSVQQMFLCLLRVAEIRGSDSL